MNMNLAYKSMLWLLQVMDHYQSNYLCKKWCHLKLQ